MIMGLDGETKVVEGGHEICEILLTRMNEEVCCHCS